MDKGGGGIYLLMLFEQIRGKKKGDGERENNDSAIYSRTR